MNVLRARLPLLANADVNGRVVGVIGGDTISVLVDGQAQRVRPAESASGGHDLHIGPRGGTHYESSSGGMQDRREGPFAAANLRAMLDQLNVPDWVQFADLNIEREWGTGRLLFAPAPLAEICRAIGMVPAAILANEDLACLLICAWYRAHREAGGERNPVVEQVIKEVAARQDGSVMAH